jgi:hypothetical protein
MGQRVSVGMTKYSKPVLGDAGNYRWPVTFDCNEDGYLGINQDKDRVTTDRVLLSPSQVEALRAFIRRRPRSGR